MAFLGFIRTRLGKWLLAAVLFAAFVLGLRRDAYRDGQSDKLMELENDDYDRARETRRRVDAARERFEPDGLHGDDNRGYRD